MKIQVHLLITVSCQCNHKDHVLKSTGHTSKVDLLLCHLKYVTMKLDYIVHMVTIHKYPLDQVQSIKRALVSKLPVVIGIMIYASFMTDDVGKTGIVPHPNLATERFIGGHALCCIGYDDNKQSFIVLNSWGSIWGDKGVCYIPYSYIGDITLCNDCHAFSDVELRLLSCDEDPDKVALGCINSELN